MTVHLPPAVAATTARQSTYERRTAETQIALTVNLDGEGRYQGTCGIGFFDHMLTLFCRHSRIDLDLTCQGDLEIDGHHTIEDLGICLGHALAKAWGDKKGIHRYGHAYLPMDETLVRVCLDLSGRPYLVWHVPIPVERIGQLETELVQEFFRALTNQAGINMHAHLIESGNGHHIVEATFKAFARALREAITIDPREGERIPSTKGVL
ncbi:imidazoleglycerol-phosphate dehydratase HisB [Heliophilum fasciatum]|uniref:Imidazoleglycerol-phosphate dehydratase n=1 Tax=Heliophilum fasciatum TaxID=35700 RepID=A0A4R2RKE2_9FIRM|nr:imidazoleglycerol-phosphate dehydratase HisB [Heliophilum fasciatum]MCW2278018.1 imidazoleglycerol-phosphate dehydratase [Heliophilum fasciatum]TCP64362.1 imidazoleglycerol-phosphate dehydratase [Heliophilum fasciatum]